MFTKLSVALVLSVLFLTPQTFALTKCEKKAVGEGSGFTGAGIVTALLGTGIDMWGLETDVEYLKSVGLTMTIIGFPIAFYGLYKEHSLSSGCKEEKELGKLNEQREKELPGIKILANEKSIGLGYQFRF